MAGGLNAPFDTVQVSLSLDRTLFSSIGSDSKTQIFLMNDLLNRCLGTMTFESQNTSTLRTVTCPRSTPEDDTVLIKDEPADVQVEEVYTDPCSITTISGLSENCAIKQEAINESTTTFNALNNSAAVEEASTSASIVDSKILPSEDDDSTKHRNITRGKRKRHYFEHRNSSLSFTKDLKLDPTGQTGVAEIVSGWSQNQPMSPANRPNVTVVETKIQSNAHVQVVHDKLRPGERAEQFGQLSHSPGHEKTRTGERLYACDLSGKTFAGLAHPPEHRRTHTGEKTFQCEYCGYSTKVASNLNKHRRIHTGEKPYNCEYCEYSCNSSYGLTVHRRIHTGEKPYKCEVCDQTFTQSSVLVSHRRIHTGEKPYRCDFCGQTFTQSGNMMAHRRIHAG